MRKYFLKGHKRLWDVDSIVCYIDIWEHVELCIIFGDVWDCGCVLYVVTCAHGCVLYLLTCVW